LTTYNGQKGLIEDIVSQRCGNGTPLAGIRPQAISTVDKYQGQQNDYIILSLVRTKSVGHLRDIRRLIVAVSRARLGMYVFCRQSLFAQCHDLKRVMEQFIERPTKLELVTGEDYNTQRKADEKISSEKKFVVDDVTVLGSIVHKMQQQVIS
jgi:intron-binding protein aquarius